MVIEFALHKELPLLPSKHKYIFLCVVWNCVCEFSVWILLECITMTNLPNPSQISSNVNTEPTTTIDSSSSSISSSTAKPKEFHFKPVFHIVCAILSLILGLITPTLLEHTAFLVNQRQYKNDDDSQPLFKQGIQRVPCSSENLKQFLHDAPVPGLHILCLPSNDSSQHVFQLYYQAYHPITLNINDDTASNHYDTNDKDRLWNYFIKYDIVSHHLKVQNHMVSNTQPWAFFSTTGQRIAGELDGSTITTTNDDNNGTPWMYTWDILKKHGMILLYEGGNWMWPGVRIGYSRMVQVDTFQKNKDTTTMMEMETLSLTPLIVSVKNFITMNECNHIQTMAEPFMEYSQVTLMDKDKGRPASDFRTSQSTFLEAGKDVILNALEDRTASLTRIPKNHQEFTQVLRYQHGEQYLAHLDWFDKQMYQNDEYTLEMIQHGKRNRLATVFWYLSNVEQGGETAFPRAIMHHSTNDTDNTNVTDVTNTNILQVKPEKGKVIIFYSLLANGSGDPLSLHSANPVKEGIKWAANKWIWNAPMEFI